MKKKRKTNVLSVLLHALDCYEQELTRQFMRAKDSRYADKTGWADKRFARDKQDIVVARRKATEQFEGG